MFLDINDLAIFSAICHRTFFCFGDYIMDCNKYFVGALLMVEGLEVTGITKVDFMKPEIAQFNF